jgi:hypothetical protein
MDGSPAQALYFVIPLSLSAVDEIHGRLSGSAQLLLIAVPLLSFSSYNFVLCSHNIRYINALPSILRQGCYGRIG